MITDNLAEQLAWHLRQRELAFAHPDKRTSLRRFHDAALDLSDWVMDNKAALLAKLDILVLTEDSGHTRLLLHRRPRTPLPGRAVTKRR